MALTGRRREVVQPFDLLGAQLDAVRGDQDRTVESIQPPVPPSWKWLLDHLDLTIRQHRHQLRERSRIQGTIRVQRGRQRCVVVCWNKVCKLVISFVGVRQPVEAKAEVES